MPGNYHFRFKTSLIPGTDREKSAVAVWMDCSDDDQHVGVWRNTIFAKVTRINMDDAEDVDFHRPAPAPATRAPAAPPAAAPRTARQQPSGRAAPHAAPAPANVVDDNLLGVFDEAPAAAPQPVAAANEGNLLGGGGGEGSLLDMNGPAYHSGSSANTSNHDDFLGMTAAPVQTPTPPVSAPAPAPMQQAPASYGNPMAGRPASRPPNGAPNNAFNQFAGNNGPFGGLEWK